MLLKLGTKPTTCGRPGLDPPRPDSLGLGHIIALAFVKAGRERMGEDRHRLGRVRGIETEAVICPTVFVDPEHGRLHG